MSVTTARLPTASVDSDCVLSDVVNLLISQVLLSVDVR